MPTYERFIELKKRAFLKLVIFLKILKEFVLSKFTGTVCGDKGCLFCLESIFSLLKKCTFWKAIDYI
jgi:hypothetical protein